MRIAAVVVGAALAACSSGPEPIIVPDALDWTLGADGSISCPGATVEVVADGPATRRIWCTWPCARTGNAEMPHVEALADLVYDKANDRWSNLGVLLSDAPACDPEAAMSRLTLPISWTAGTTVACSGADTAEATGLTRYLCTWSCVVTGLPDLPFARAWADFTWDGSTWTGPTVGYSPGPGCG